MGRKDDQPFDAMMEPIRFTVRGKPQPAGSKRAFALKVNGQYTGRAVVTDDNKKSSDWKADVRAEAVKVAPAHPLTGPLKLRVCFYVARPKGHFGTGRNAEVLKSSAPPFPTSKPDTTKLLRGLEDACTAILWKDDAQIVSQHVYKRYGTPGAVVELSEEVP